MRRKLRAGIIGCGNIAGWNELDSARERPCTHLGAYRTRKDVEVVGCCDIDMKRAAKFARQFHIGFYTDSIDSLLAKGIDILSICVPYNRHFSVLKEAANTNRHPRMIFLEKPISDDLARAKAMVELCREKKILLFVNNRRVSAFYQAFKDAIKDKFDNEIIFVSAWCSSGIHAIGVHMIDLLRNICGDVKWVFATREKEFVRSLPYSHNYTANDPRFCSSLGFKNGLRGVFLNTAKTDFTYFEIEVLCRKGRIRAVDNGRKIVYQKKIEPGSSTLSYRLGKEKAISFTSRPLFKDLIDEIIDGDYKSSPINGKEALESYKIVNALRHSAEEMKIKYL